MSIETLISGVVDDQTVHLHTIKNSSGASLVVSELGATAIQMNMPSPEGILADVILGYDQPEDYLHSPTYFGATVGRFGNRIRRGKFRLDDQGYQVSCNEGDNSLHGGINGFDKKIWKSDYKPDDDTVSFKLTSPDGDEGFPGKLEIESSYRLTDQNVVRIDLHATTDKPTICNIVHHSYFNLAGHESGHILNQELQIYSDFYTPVDEELIISGEVSRVADSPFDFRTMHPIGQDIHNVPNAGAGRLEAGGVGGYDHNWCLRGEPGLFRPVLKAIDPDSGRGFELFTTEPGVHFYTGGYLDESIVGKGGVPYQQFAGFTLETQKFPDGPNLSHVPQSRLNPGELYHHILEFQFFT